MAPTVASSTRATTQSDGNEESCAHAARKAFLEQQERFGDPCEITKTAPETSATLGYPDTPMSSVETMKKHFVLHQCVRSSLELESERY
jgi:hypothetical protein